MAHKHNNAEENDTIFDKLARLVKWSPPEGDEEYVDMDIEISSEDEAPGIGDS